jgi:hypothetical protein
MKTLLLFLSLIFSLNVNARLGSGNDKGNGGFLMSCQNGEQKLLDFYEAENLYSFKLRQSSSSSNLNSELELFQQSLRSVSVEIATKIAIEIQFFLKNSKFIRGELGLSQDSKQVFLPQNCELKQFALQRERPMTGQVLFLVSEEIWNRSSGRQQVGLIIHEILYKNSNQSDSRGVRRLTGFLFSTELLKKNLDRIENEFFKAGVSL